MSSNKIVTITLPAGKFNLSRIYSKSKNKISGSYRDRAKSAPIDVSALRKDFQREIIDFLLKRSDNLLYTGEVSQSELLRSLSKEIEKL